MTQILKFVVVISKSFSKRYSLFVGSLTNLHFIQIKARVAGYPEYRDELNEKERGCEGDQVRSYISTFLLEELSKTTKDLGQIFRYSNRNSKGNVPNVT